MQMPVRTFDDAAWQRWLRDGEELRAQAQAEYDLLMVRARELQKILAFPAPEAGAELAGSSPTRLPSHPPSAPAPPSSPGDSVSTSLNVVDVLQVSANALRKLSMPQLVKRIVHAQPDGIRTRTVFELVRQVNPKTEPSLVHSALYRNVEAGEIRSVGQRATRKYYPDAPPTNAAHPVEDVGEDPAS